MQQRATRPCPARSIGRRDVAGVTLLELMVAIAVVAILMAIAVPSFRSIINTNRLSSGANELLAMVQLAKIEAVRRNSRVVLCASANGTSCSGANNWRRVIAFTDANKDGAVSAGEVVLRDSEFLPSLTLLASPSISGATSPNRITVGADGMTYPGTSRASILQGKLRVCLGGTVPVQNARDVSIAGSRVSVDSPHASSSACAAPAN